MKRKNLKPYNLFLKDKKTGEIKDIFTIYCSGKVSSMIAYKGTLGLYPIIKKGINFKREIPNKKNSSRYFNDYLLNKL